MRLSRSGKGDQPNGVSRSVDQVRESVVVTGDDNVVLVLNGNEVAQVSIPQSRSGVRSLLFGRDRPPNLAAVGSWLRPDAGVLTPQQRPELQSLAEWCATPQESVMRLLCGAGGQGKTFLAAQLCAEMSRKQWLAGFVVMPPANWRALSFADTSGVMDALGRDLRRLPELTAGIHAAVRTQTPTLMVIDYAENVAPVVDELLKTVADVDGYAYVRILLLARYAGGWWRELTLEHPYHRWIESDPLVLESLARTLTSEELNRVWSEAVETLTRRAAEWGLAVRPVRADTRPPASLSTTLHLYADALMHVIDPTNGMSASGDEALIRVVEHEHRQATHAFRAQQVDLSLSQRDWAILTAALRPVATVDDGARVLGGVPVLCDLEPAALRNVAEVLHRLYPHDAGTDLWQAPQPDPLVDVHLRQMAGDAPTDAEFMGAVVALCGTSRHRSAMHAAKVLHRCWSSIDPGSRSLPAYRRLEAALRELVARWPEGYVPALTTLEPEHFAADIVAAVGGGDADHAALELEPVRQLDQMLRSMESTYTRGEIAVAVSRRLVAETRCAEDASPDMRDRHAAELSTLSARLAATGLTGESLAVIENAVAVRQQLAAEEFARYGEPYAEAVVELSVRLDRIGARRRSLAAAKKAVALYRKAAKRERTLLPLLADALNALSLRWRSLGDEERSLAASAESVAISRTLVGDAEAIQADLARALNNHSLRLGDFGRIESSLAAITEAADIYRALAQAKPAHFRRLWSTALHNLAFRMRQAGRYAESLDVFEDELAIRRELAGNTSNRASRAELAASLAGRALVLLYLLRDQEGLESAREAVELYRTAVERGRPAHQLKFAAVLMVLAHLLARTGDDDSAFAALREALAIQSAQLRQGDVNAVPDIIQALDGLRRVQRMVDRSKRAARRDFTEAHNAVQAVRDSSRQKSGASPADVARTLDLLSEVLTAGESKESLAAAEEAANIWEKLAIDDPGTYRESFVVAVHALVQRLVELRIPLNLNEMAARIAQIPRTDAGASPLSDHQGHSETADGLGDT